MSDIGEAFLRQSAGCGRLGSPFMQRLMALFAFNLSPGTAVADRMLAWSGDPSTMADSVPLRIAGGLHALKRRGHPYLSVVYPPHEPDDGSLWGVVEATLRTEEDFLLKWLDNPPQTNEVRRAAVLIPAIHMLTDRYRLPIRMIELGASAGLNLSADRFYLSAGDTAYGDPDSLVQLAPEWHGPTPAATQPLIGSRLGVDRAPIDPVDDAERLLAYLWPDQEDRIARTEAAVTIFRLMRPHMVNADAVAWLEDSAPSLTERSLTLVYHTIAWQYLSDEAQARGNALIDALGAKATDQSRLARLSMEDDGEAARVTLQVWPNGGTIDLGRADYHARWVEWYSAELPEEWV